MKRFQFKLQPALELRRRQEEAAAAALAEKQRLLQREQAQLTEFREEMRRHQDYRGSLQRSGVAIQDLVDADQYATALMRSLIMQQEKAAAAGRAVDAALDALKERRVDRETLEKLRERRAEEHTHEMLRQEQAALDEGTVLRWRRSERTHG